jgi:hypothetical protein
MPLKLYLLPSNKVKGFPTAGAASLRMRQFATSVDKNLQPSLFQPIKKFCALQKRTTSMRFFKKWSAAVSKRNRKRTHSQRDIPSLAKRIDFLGHVVEFLKKKWAFRRWFESAETNRPNETTGICEAVKHRKRVLKKFSLHQWKRGLEIFSRERYIEMNAAAAYHWRIHGRIKMFRQWSEFLERKRNAIVVFENLFKSLVRRYLRCSVNRWLAWNRRVGLYAKRNEALGRDHFNSKLLMVVFKLWKRSYREKINKRKKVVAFLKNKDLGNAWIQWHSYFVRKRKGRSRICSLLQQVYAKWCRNLLKNAFIRFQNLPPVVEEVVLPEHLERMFRDVDKEMANYYSRKKKCSP